MTFRLTGARWATLAAAITLSTTSLSVPAHAAEAAETAAAPTEQLTLDVRTVNGSGCPAGSARVAMLPDNTGFRIIYTDFLAQDGGQARPTDNRKNCQVNLLVHIPQGFTFAIARAEYRGRAYLSPGTTALERSNYYYTGSADNHFVDHAFNGPMNGTWRTTDSTPVEELVFAPCGAVRSLNINTELRVNAGNSTATNYISMRTSEGQVDTIVQFQWRRC